MVSTDMFVELQVLNVTDLERVQKSKTLDPQFQNLQTKSPNITFAYLMRKKHMAV